MNNAFEKWLDGQVTTAEMLLYYTKEVQEHEEVSREASSSIAQGMIDDLNYMKEVYR